MRWLGLLLLGLCLAAGASAHEIRPGLLEITEREGGWIDVAWKVPMRGDRALALEPVLPEGLEPLGPPSRRVVPGAFIQLTSYRGDAAALVGQTIEITGLSALQTDVLVRIDLLDGTSHSAILRPGSPAYRVPTRAGKAEVSWSYWRMGTTHILEGVDHLLFLLALLLIVEGFGKLVKTVTAFTVAHSITLALATLGFVNVPPAPTEAIISLSIVFLAGELLRKLEGQDTLTERRPWLVALSFGLFHGLGFAGALSQVGVPPHEVPLALLMFNVGVETGQLVFVAAVVAALAGLRRLPVPAPEGSRRLAPYAIGALAAFWTIERLVRAFGGTT